MSNEFSQFVDFDEFSNLDRIKAAVGDVLARLPAGDLEVIAKKKILFREGQSLDGVTVSSCKAVTDSRSAHRCMIEIEPEAIPDDTALRGAVAFELARARNDYHQQARRRQALVRSGPRPEQAAAAALAQRIAEHQVITWGFTAEWIEFSLFISTRRQALTWSA